MVRGILTEHVMRAVTRTVFPGRPDFALPYDVREQAVTALKAKAIPLVIAGSFSQTYLRNAFNNGFLCIEVPELVRRLREQLAKEIATKEKTIIPGEDIDIDFTLSTIDWRGETFPFPALGSVPQSLVIAQGVENLVARRLGLA